jgi:uncharacterized protein (PEP-CTERM system associated)
MASNRWQARKYCGWLVPYSKSDVNVAVAGMSKLLAISTFIATCPAPAADLDAESRNFGEVALGAISNWRIEPRLQVRETYSDNIGLARSNAAKSEFVTAISPGISIRSSAARSNIDVNYSLNKFFYVRDSDRDTLNHQLRGSASFELVDDLIYLDTLANISQQAVSAFGPIGANSSVNENSRTFRSYSIAPYFRKAFGREATIEARYTFSQLSSDVNSSAISDSTGNRAILKAESGPAFNNWGWGVEYLDDRIDYTRSADTNFRRLTGNLRYRITPRLFGTSSFGVDKNDYVTIGEKPEGAFWTLGGDWRPSRRTALTFSAGRRYFGNTYALSFQHATRRTSWDVSYQQNLSTSRSQFAQPLGVTLRESAETGLRTQNPDISDAALQDLVDARVRDLISAGLDPDAAQGINFQSNTAFLEKKWQGLVTFNYSKSALILRAFDSIRDSATTGTASVLNSSGDFALSQIIKQSGIGSSLRYRLSPRNNANVGLDLTRVRLVDIGRTDNLTTFNLGVSRKLSRSADGSLGYRHVRRDSNFNANDYDENSFFGTFLVTF